MPAREATWPASGGLGDGKGGGEGHERDRSRRQSGCRRRDGATPRRTDRERNRDQEVLQPEPQEIHGEEDRRREVLRRQTARGSDHERHGTDIEGQQERAEARRDTASAEKDRR